MKNKRKIIIIVVCVIAAAAIAVGAGLGYYYSRPERTAEKVLTAVYTVDNEEIQRRREAIDNRTLTHICASGATVLLPINAPKA